jgi:putative ABC transport system permease protein
MFRNYLKLAFKSTLKQGHQSIISAIGLSVALACSILILLYVQYEVSYDNFNVNAENIYRIITKQSASFSYMGKDVFAITPAPLKDALANEIPEVKNSTRSRLTTHSLEYSSSLFYENGFLYADPAILNIFTFPVISGNPLEELKDPFTLFITKEMAVKYFGNEDPLGKTIIADNKYVFTVRGILENIPQNSHLDFDFLTGFETLYSMRGGKESVEKWGNFSYTTYIQLLDNVKPEDISGKLKELADKYLPKQPVYNEMQWIPVPLRSIHLGGKANFDTGNISDIRYLYLLIAIGVFIILIACFNYLNMATARAYNRGRETGILKVAGSSKTDLIIQFILESVLISSAGLILAVVIICFILPAFSAFTERPLTFRMIFEFTTLIKVFALTLLTGIFAGFYPAVHLSSISPLHLIKEEFKNLGGKRSAGKLRNLLVVLQYTISIVALICTFTVLNQLSFIKNTDIGFERDNIITIYLEDPAIRSRPEVLISEMKENPEIEDVSLSSYLPHAIGASSFGSWEGKASETNMNIFRTGIGNNFTDFYNLKIVSGRGFSKDFSSDSLNSFIINQKAAKMIGWDNPVGKKIGFTGEEMGNVIGVVKDFNFQSLHHAVEPLAISLVGCSEFPEAAYISVKTNPGSLNDTRLYIEKKLKELSPHYLNPVSILNEQVDSMYRSDRKLSTMFIFATVLAVILTCLGQYGLSSYTAKGRTKEMAIRKVMGSQTSGIMVILTGEMAKWILVSIVFAWPIAYLLMNKWLQNFAYQIKMEAGVFLLSLLISLVISLIAISYHVVKLSSINPAELIRHE